MESEECRRLRRRFELDRLFFRTLSESFSRSLLRWRRRSLRRRLESDESEDTSEEEEDDEAAIVSEENWDLKGFGQIVQKRKVYIFGVPTNNRRA